MITPIAATRQLTASAPVIARSMTPVSAPTQTVSKASPSFEPNVAKALIDTAPVAIQRVQEIPRSESTFVTPQQSTYKAPEPTQTISTPSLPPVIVAERQAASAILTPRTYSDAIVSVPEPTQTVTNAAQQSFSPVAEISRQTPVTSNVAPSRISVPSSDISSPILSAAAKVFYPANVQQVPSSPTPSVSQPSGRPVNQVSQGQRQNMSLPVSSGTPVNQASQPSSMPSLLSTPLLSGGSGSGMPQPGVYAPDHMRVRGVQDRYRDDWGRGETNVIVPQVSMPTQITQTTPSPYQIPTYSPDVAIPTISAPGGQTPYVGVVPQQTQEAPMDSAYKTVKVLALVGVGVGALYWLVGKLAPKVEFKR